MAEAAEKLEAPGTDIPGETEAKARDMGWKPEEEWEGDTTGWMPADAFVERQDKRRAIVTEEVKAENERLQADLDALKAEQTETSQTLDEFKVLHSRVEQKAYERAMKDIQATQRDAAEAGDVKAFDAAQKEADALVDEAAKPATEPRRASPDDDPTFKAWVKNNGWYKTDARLRAFAHQMKPEIIATQRFQGNEPEYYDAITEAVKLEFPDKFANPNRKKAAAVEEPGGAPPRNKDGNSYAGLPAEAKAACERFIKQGVYIDKDGKAMTAAKAREKYVADYYEE